MTYNLNFRKKSAKFERAKKNHRIGFSSGEKALFNPESDSEASHLFLYNRFPKRITIEHLWKIDRVCSDVGKSRREHPSDSVSAAGWNLNLNCFFLSLSLPCPRPDLHRLWCAIAYGSHSVAWTVITILDVYKRGNTKTCCRNKTVIIILVRSPTHGRLRGRVTMPRHALLEILDTSGDVRVFRSASPRRAAASDRLLFTAGTRPTIIPTAIIVGARILRRSTIFRRYSAAV